MIPAPPVRMTIRSSVIRVWRIALDDWSALTPARLAWLDPDESARAERFYGTAHAQRWRVAHVALREILGEATNTHPRDLQFVRGPQGKPALAGVESLAFNLSHAADIAVVAVGGRVALGVDVEHVSDAPDLADLALTHFAEDERASIASLDDAERVRAFYRCWTRKEAVVKALGVGIGYDLQSFSVTVTETPAILLRGTPPLLDVARWTLVALDLPEPYVGALAIPQPEATVSVARWASGVTR